MNYWLMGYSVVAAIWFIVTVFDREYIEQICKARWDVKDPSNQAWPKILYISATLVVAIMSLFWPLLILDSIRNKFSQ